MPVTKKHLLELFRARYTAQRWRCVHLHKVHHEGFTLRTLFDSENRIVLLPSKYLERLRIRHTRDSTLGHIAEVLKLHCAWLEKVNRFHGFGIDEALALVDSGDILEWVNDQRAKGLQERTINNREVLVRNMYEYFTTKEAAVRNDIPWHDKNFTNPCRNKLPRHVTAEQLIRLLLGMRAERQRVAAHFIFDTGVRISELTRLKRKDLLNLKGDGENSNYFILRVQGSKAHGGNAFKERDTLISRPMLSRVRKYHSSPEYLLAKRWGIYDPEKPVFLNEDGEALSTSSFYKIIKNAWKRQGGAPGEVSPHRLRHGTAYSILRSELGKGDFYEKILLVKSSFGHENYETTEIYCSIPVSILRAISDRNETRTRYEEADEIYRKTYFRG